MQKEYKDTMEQISLSEDAKKRILANVLETYEKNPKPDVEKAVTKKPRFSIRQIGTVAAAVVVLCISTAFIYSHLIGTTNTGNVSTSREDDPMTLPAEVAWTELDSVDDISKETDCKTYTLGNVSKKYKVKKVEVAKEQKHVKITYQNKHKTDKIMFEYKEEENAEDITGQFSEETELTTEKVGDSDVKMYGNEKCDGMTWQKEAYTFAVRMTKACTTEHAKKLVSGTAAADKAKKTEDKDGDNTKKDGTDKASSHSKAVGWTGDEKASTHKEKKDILKLIYNRLGFRVTITDPASDIAYKKVGDFESFAFYYPEDEGMTDCRIIGYAGLEGSPEGVMTGFEESGQTTIETSNVSIYENESGEKRFTFTKEDISFTLLIDGWVGDNVDDVLGEIFSVIRISMDNGDAKPAATKNPEDEEEETTDEDKVLVSGYRDRALKIQDAVVEESLKKLSGYIEYPITIKDIGTISSAKEFQALSVDAIFTSNWIDSVVSYDTGKIKKDTQTFTMGDASKSIVCKIKNNSVVITELHLEKVKTEVTPSATPLVE